MSKTKIHITKLQKINNLRKSIYCKSKTQNTSGLRVKTKMSVLDRRRDLNLQINNSFLIPNLLNQEIVLNNNFNIYKRSKEFSRWKSNSSDFSQQEFPSAFLSCDNIYSNKKHIQKIKSSNTLFIENPVMNEYDARTIFEEFSGFLGLKTNLYYGKTLCFITFKNVECAKKALEKLEGNDNWNTLTFAKNPTRDLF